MNRTEKMVEAEVERLDLLHAFEVLLHSATEAPTDYIREQFLEESIKCLMIGSHSGRVG